MSASTNTKSKTSNHKIPAQIKNKLHSQTIPEQPPKRLPKIVFDSESSSSFAKTENSFVNAVLLYASSLTPDNSQTSPSSDFESPHLKYKNYKNFSTLAKAKPNLSSKAKSFNTIKSEERVGIIENIPEKKKKCIDQTSASCACVTF
ncbi:hypothetical protein SteCoe_11487 [Stentor coeruleus]|uniref:Uncharacterized protein n=1 Tax=Stentor coeruleus TaxID=5963 RepID=A0A1R2CD75_9CILI|nr:hypothetical protein SteCoe_11487 [Stentor coeruleus]